MATNLGYDAATGRFFVAASENTACLKRDDSGRFEPIVGFDDGQYYGAETDSTARWLVSALITAVISGWTATHTGLPSLRIVGPRTVYSGSRVVDVVGDETAIVSDPLAAPGVNEYTDGETTITVSRTVGIPWHAIFTNSAGRGVEGLLYVNNSDPVGYSPDVTQFNRRVARWSIEPPPRTGTGVLVLTDPSLEDDVWATCRAREHVVIAPAKETPGVPLRSVIITGISRSRISASGVLQFELSWSEFEPASSAAPVVTWGEYAAASDGVFTDESYEEICQRVAGMPV